MLWQWICGKLGKAFTELVFPWIKVGILIGSDSIMMQIFFYYAGISFRAFLSKSV